MKCKFILGLIFFTSISAASQRFYTKSAKIDFDATAPSSPEKVKGSNHTAVCVLDTKTGALQFSVLMKGFEFDRALMQEHFNENYVESSKFPKAEFKGSIVNNDKINYSAEGKYKVEVKGMMSIHGETKEVSTTGELDVKEGKIKAEANFTVALADYKISIPSLVADKVSKTARIEVDCKLEPLKN